MSLHAYDLLDVFTDRPLAGSQLAVFWDTDSMGDSLLQQVAREMNLAETVFLTHPRDGGAAAMRIFTTVTEVPFAGHPILGTACLLAQTRHPAGSSRVTLETGRGPVAVEVQHDGTQVAFGRMAQPDDVLAIEPDFALLARITGGARINCFAASTPGSCYTTRMFSPLSYVPEDPATGASAGPLAAHLVRHGLLASGTEIEISQGLMVGRPSTLYASATVENGRITGVTVAGHSYRTGSGSLNLPTVAR